MIDAKSQSVFNVKIPKRQRILSFREVVIINNQSSSTSTVFWEDFFRGP